MTIESTQAVSKEKLYYQSIFLMMAIALVMACPMPRSLAFAPGALALIALIAGFFIFGQRPQLLPRRYLAMLLTLLATGALSILWSVNPEVSSERVTKLAGVFIAGGMLPALALSLNEKGLKTGMNYICVALIILSSLTTIEIILDSPLYRLIRIQPPLIPVFDHVYNRGAVSVILCFFPAFYYARHVRKSMVLTLLLCLSVLSMILSVESQSAQLAILIGAIFYIGFPYRSSITLKGLLVLLCSLIIVAPYLSIWMFNELAPIFDELPFLGKGDGFAGARLEIWDYVSRYALQNPLNGFGIEATRTIENFDSGQIYQLGTSILHPHNFALQLWIEFGLIGVALGLCVTALILLDIKKMAHITQKRVALSTYMCALSVSAMAYGMWQSWWVGLLFLSSAVTIMNLRLISIQSSDEQRQA
jgi:O-antigen ligase